MPHTIVNDVRRERVAHTAVEDLQAHRADLLVIMARLDADLLVIMARLDRAELRAAHMRMAATITALDDTIAAIEASR